MRRRLPMTINPLKSKRLFSLTNLASMLILCGLSSAALADCTASSGTFDVLNSGGSVFSNSAGNCDLDASYNYFSNTSVPIINNSNSIDITFNSPDVYVNTGGTIDDNGKISGVTFRTSDRPIYATFPGSRIIFNGNLRVDNTDNPLFFSTANYGEAIKIGNTSGRAGGQVLVHGSLIANSSAPNTGTIYVYDGLKGYQSMLSVDGNYKSVNSGIGSSSLYATTGGFIDIKGSVDIKMINLGGLGSDQYNSYAVLATRYSGNCLECANTGADGLMYSTVNFGGGNIIMQDDSIGPTATSNSALRAIQQGNINVYGDLTVTTNGWYARGLYISGNPNVDAESTITLGTATKAIATDISTSGVGANGIDIGKTTNSLGKGAGNLILNGAGALSVRTSGFYASPIKIEYNKSLMSAVDAAHIEISSAYSALMYGRGPDDFGEPGLSDNLSVALNNADISTTFTAADRNSDADWQRWRNAMQIFLTADNPVGTTISITGDTCQANVSLNGASTSPPTARGCALISVRGATNSKLDLTNSRATASADSALLDVGDDSVTPSQFTLNASNSVLNGALEVHDTSSLDVNLSNASIWNLATCTECSAHDAISAVQPNTSSFNTLNVISGSTLNASADNFILVGKVNIGDASSGGTLNLVDASLSSGKNLLINGALNMQSNDSALNIAVTEANLVAADGTSDAVILVNGDTTLAGTLNLSSISTTRPTHASQVEVIDASGVFRNKNTLDILRSTTPIQGDFLQIKGYSVKGMRDYLNYTAQVVNVRDTTAISAGYVSEYDISFGMSWFAQNSGATGNFTLQNQADSFEVDLPLSDQIPMTSTWDGKSLNKQGAGDLILSAQNTYSGKTEVGAGRLILTGVGDIASSSELNLSSANSVFDISGISATGTSVQNLQGAIGSNVLMAGKNLTVNSSSDSEFAGEFDASAGSLIKEGKASLTLSGKQFYRGDSIINAGTLILDGKNGGAHLDGNVVGKDGSAFILQNGATLIGQVDPTDMSIDSSSLWNMRGTSVVGQLVNAGTIIFLMPSRSLTATHDFIGENGLIQINTHLGDDTSPSARLIINGDSSGFNWLAVNNVRGAGALTTNGIRVVEVDGNSAAKFKLQGRAVAGIYEYFLHQGIPNFNDGDWYLRSEGDEDNGGGGGGGGDGGDGGEPVLRPEVATYLANQNAANSMFIHTLHERLGESMFSSDVPGCKPLNASVWARINGNKQGSEAAKGQLDTTTNTGIVQVGADLIKWRDNKSRIQAGLMFSAGKADSTSHAKHNQASADGKVTGYAFGIYATWYAAGNESNEGAYVDSWFQYGRYSNSVKGDWLDEQTYDSHNWLASIEGGYAIALSKNPHNIWYIEPQLQVIYRDYHQNEVIEVNGTRVHDENNHEWLSRLGGRFYARPALKNGMKLKPFVEFNWLHSTNDAEVFLSSELNSAHVNSDIPSNRGEVKLGIEAELSKNWNIWAHVGYQQGTSGYRQTEGNLGVKYLW